MTQKDVVDFISNPIVSAFLSALLSSAGTAALTWLIKVNPQARQTAQTVANYNAALLASMRTWEGYRLGGYALPGPEKLGRVLLDMEDFFKAAGITGDAKASALAGVTADVENLLPLVDPKKFAER